MGTVMGTASGRELLQRVLVASVLLLGGCSSSDSSKEDNRPVTETTRPTFVPPEAVAAEPIDGASIWVDEAKKTVYVSDCEVARRITAEGQKYGPGPRDPETLKFTPGYAFICP